MAQLNRAQDYSHVRTHEDAPAWPHMTPEQALRRSVMSCFLWEKEFYEDGQEIAGRIETLAAQVHPASLAKLAIEARTVGNLRHVPLLLLCTLAARSKDAKDMTPSIASVIAETISRADELSELLAVYWRNGKRPLSAQMKKGLARAFTKFDAYALAKYDRENAIRLRDVLFLCHAKPKDAEQDALWKKLVAGELPAPDTWEVALSGGADKRETFERLLRSQKLGYLALLRNLRNMSDAGVDDRLVCDAIEARRGAQRVLPFRYVSAVKHAPRYAWALGEALLASIADLPPLGGKTVVCVDTSASMQRTLSEKSQLSRVDAAATLASMIVGEVRLVQFASIAQEIPFYRGLAGIDAINNRIGSVGHGTDIDAAVRVANSFAPDRIIVITDEQSRTRVSPPQAKHAYVINVASAKNGVGYGAWVHIDGFSESTLKFISEYEKGA